MVKTVEIGSLITQSPELREGRLIITGTGVSVRRIVSWYLIFVRSA